MRVPTPGSQPRAVGLSVPAPELDPAIYVQRESAYRLAGFADLRT
jgi:hypothetical protein